MAKNYLKIAIVITKLILYVKMSNKEDNNINVISNLIHSFKPNYSNLVPLPNFNSINNSLNLITSKEMDKRPMDGDIPEKHLNQLTQLQEVKSQKANLNISKPILLISPLIKIKNGQCNPIFEFKCGTGSPPCIAIYDVCDRIDHCEDGSDEIECSGYKQQQQQKSFRIKNELAPHPEFMEAKNKSSDFLHQKLIALKISLHERRKTLIMGLGVTTMFIVIIFLLVWRRNFKTHSSRFQNDGFSYNHKIYGGYQTDSDEEVNQTLNMEYNYKKLTRNEGILNSRHGHDDVLFLKQDFLSKPLPTIKRQKGFSLTFRTNDKITANLLKPLLSSGSAIGDINISNTIGLDTFANDPAFSSDSFNIAENLDLGQFYESCGAIKTIKMQKPVLMNDDKLKVIFKTDTQNDNSKPFGSFIGLQSHYLDNFTAKTLLKRKQPQNIVRKERMKTRNQPTKFYVNMGPDELTKNNNHTNQPL